LEKAVEHLDNSISEKPEVFVKNDTPFALRMRMHKYIKAFNMQMKNNPDVDENKYNHLVLTSNTDELVITSSLENKSLILTTEGGEEL
tara:strand:- start:8357 stop:8620 length:264 start_codon:yes stop_codon:yes gene_type:complete